MSLLASLIFLSSQGTDKVSFPMLIITIFAFLILFFILAKFAWPTILKNLDEREKKINDALEKASDIEENLKKANAHSDEIIKKANDEARIILEEARQAADLVKKEIELEAEIQVNKIKKNAKKEIEQNRLDASKSLKQESINFALDLAEKVLQENFDKEKSTSFIKKLLKES